MPSLGADMEDGTLVEWMVAEGDTVARGDVIAVVETQKGAIEIECFEAGQVSKLLVDLGQVVPVGAPLAMIGDEAEAATPAAVAPAPSRPPKPEPAPLTPAAPVAAVVQPPIPEQTPAPATASIPSTSGHPRASPAARVRARDLGVALNTITGTGPEGAIVLADVERFAPSDAATSPQITAPSGKDAMRKAIASAMARSKQTIPHFYLSQTIDAQLAIDHLAALNANRAPAERVLLGAMLMRATALAARAVPSMAGHFEDGSFDPATHIHVGLAIALRGGGLVAPAIMDADLLTLDDTMAAMRDLVSRARAGRLRGTEMTAGTITMSSLGEAGAEAMAGIIFPPQVALVGVGAPQTRPWVVGQAIEPRRVLTLTLSVDHRVNDGRLAARFAAEFDRRLQTPEEL